MGFLPSFLLLTRPLLRKNQFFSKKKIFSKNNFEIEQIFVFFEEKMLSLSKVLKIRAFLEWRCVGSTAVFPVEWSALIYYAN